MNRRLEFLLASLLLLLAVVLRAWDLGSLPSGFNNDELAYIRMTETMREGSIAVYYMAGGDHPHAGGYAIVNMLATALVGDGLIGYRMLPLWGSLVTLALLYALARRLFGPAVALIALGAMAVNFRAVLLARTASAEAFVPLYTILVLLVLASAFNLRRDIRFRTPGTLSFALLAALCGMSGYLHYTALALGPLAALFFAHLLVTHQPLSRRVWSAAVFVLVLATVIAVPYLISTLREPSFSEPYVLWAERPSSVTGLIDGALRAVGGVIWRGDARVTHNLPDLALVGPAMAVLLIVGVIESLRRWRQPGYALIVMALLAGVITDAWVGRDTNFAASLVALPAVFILPGIGAVAIWRARGTRSAWQPVTVALTVMLIVNVLVIRHRLGDTWRNDPQVQAAYHAHLAALAAYLDRTPDDLPVSVCSVPLRARNGELSPRQILRLMMHREGLPLRYSDCRGGLVLIDAGTPMRFAFTSTSDRAQMPPELADWLTDGQPIPVDGLPEGMVMRLDVFQRLRDAGGYWDALATAYFMPDDTGGTGPVKLPVAFEDGLTFAGYDPRVFETARVPGGDPVVLATIWRVDEPLPPDLGIFAHVLAYLDAEQRVLLIEPWAEANTIDVIPSGLKPRDFFIQVSYIWLGDSLTQPEYALTVGAYQDTVTVLANHLQVIDGDTGLVRGDRLLLGNIRMDVPSEPESASGP